MKRRHFRLGMIVLGGAVLALAATLVLFALSDNIVFFQTPSDVAASKVPPNQRFRIGGLVGEGSIREQPDSRVEFVITDGAADVQVRYQGLLPDLFREGQGVVAEGHVDENLLFHADTILAKHDENYMPAEVTEALKEAGTWRGDAASMPSVE